ncbi:MAG: uracil-DNA glycosylase [Anaerolineae bacterium]
MIGGQRKLAAPRFLFAMIEEFIGRLAQVRPGKDVFNQYDDTLEANVVRRRNLHLYLQQMRARNPAMLLVGEAPGYRGGRLTGVPFTSPHFLTRGIEALGLLGEAQGYQPVPEWPDIRREATATIVWQTMIELNIVPLMWNAFPFHPFRATRPRSNRSPRAKELRFGGQFLLFLLAMYSITTVTAVGQRAAHALNLLGIDHVVLRHPSHGGKARFVQGVKRLAATMR